MSGYPVEGWDVPHGYYAPDEPCGCGQCSDDVQHASHCAVHNGPAFPAGPCDCGTKPKSDKQGMTMRPFERSEGLQKIMQEIASFGLNMIRWDRLAAEIDGAMDQKDTEMERLRLVAWAAYRELNEIRARDGIPWTHQRCKASVDERYFSAVVDALKLVLGEDAKPWPAKRWLDADNAFILPGQSSGDDEGAA